MYPCSYLLVSPAQEISLTLKMLAPQGQGKDAATEWYYFWDRDSSSVLSLDPSIQSTHLEVGICGLVELASPILPPPLYHLAAGASAVVAVVALHAGVFPHGSSSGVPFLSTFA